MCGAKDPAEKGGWGLLVRRSQNLLCGDVLMLMASFGKRHLATVLLLYILGTTGCTHAPQESSPHQDAVLSKTAELLEWAYFHFEEGDDHASLWRLYDVHTISPRYRMPFKMAGVIYAIGGGYMDRAGAQREIAEWKAQTGKDCHAIPARASFEMPDSEQWNRLAAKLKTSKDSLVIHRKLMQMKLEEDFPGVEAGTAIRQLAEYFGIPVSAPNGALKPRPTPYKVSEGWTGAKVARIFDLLGEMLGLVYYVRDGQLVYMPQSANIPPDIPLETPVHCPNCKGSGRTDGYTNDAQRKILDRGAFFIKVVSIGDCGCDRCRATGLVEARDRWIYPLPPDIGR